MLVNMFLILLLSPAVILFICTWRTYVLSPFKKLSDTHKSVKFYDNDTALKQMKKTTATYIGDICGLDTHIRGDVRYNQSMYYDAEEFKEIKKEVLSKNFPMPNKESIVC